MGSSWGIIRTSGIYRCPSDPRKEGKAALPFSLVRSYSQTLGIGSPFGSQDMQGIAAPNYITGTDQSWSQFNGKIKRASLSIINFDFSGTNTLGTGDGDANAAANVAAVAGNITYWTHGFSRMNFLFADKHAEYLNFKDTVDGRPASVMTWGVDTRNTMWDCWR